MNYYHAVDKRLRPGTLVAHKVFMTSKEDIYRIGIVKFDVDDKHVFVMWCPCDDYPVSKGRSIYSSPVNTINLEVLNEIP